MRIDAGKLQRLRYDKRTRQSLLGLDGDKQKLAKQRLVVLGSLLQLHCLRLPLNMSFIFSSLHLSSSAFLTSDYIPTNFLHLLLSYCCLLISRVTRSFIFFFKLHNLNNFQTYADRVSIQKCLHAEANVLFTV